MSHEHIKTAVDGVSAGTAFATLFGWLPHVASLLTVIWFAIRIYETKTVQRLLGKEQ